MKKIIVFGASGDIGKNFINYFIHKNNIEYQICACSRSGADYYRSLGIQHYRIDITNKDDFKILPMNEVYAIVNFAGLMPARMKGYDPYKHIDVNLIGNLNILEYCRMCHADRILFSHSFGDIKDYGEQGLLLKTDMPRKFSFSSDHTLYVMCKDFTVDLMKNYYEMYGLKYFVLRCPTIYLWSHNSYYYVDGKLRKISYRYLIEQAIGSKPIEVWGDPSRKKDMPYVIDACQMFYKALFVHREHGIYNVGTGIGIPLLEQIQGIINVFSPANNPSKIILAPNKPNAPQYIMDIQPAIDELDYQPEFTYISMLRDMKRLCDTNNLY